MTDRPGGDEAAWRDLVARLEQPAPSGLSAAPWPDRENAPVPPADAAGSAGDEESERYVPPPAPPLPKLSPAVRAAWLGLFGGPGYLFAATLLGWQVHGWEALAAIAAFVAGFTVLVIRLGDGPSRRDDPDQGAVV
jgi:hypothetical protein